MCTQLPETLVSNLTQQQEPGLIASMAAAHATNTQQLIVTYEYVLAVPRRHASKSLTTLNR